jgi:hypothetical protein
MNDLIKMLDPDVYQRYHRSIVNVSEDEVAIKPVARWREALILKDSTRLKLLDWHKAEIDKRVCIGQDPTEAPLLIRHYAIVALESAGQVRPNWEFFSIHGQNLSNLVQLSLERIAIANASARLMFYIAAKEIDPLRCYELEYKYDGIYYQHLIRCLLKAYKDDQRQFACGQISHINESNYYDVLRDAVVAYADAILNVLRQSKNSLSGYHPIHV